MVGGDPPQEGRFNSEQGDPRSTAGLGGGTRLVLFEEQKEDGVARTKLDVPDTLCVCLHSQRVQGFFAPASQTGKGKLLK